MRELENVIERAFILCQAERIGPEHLPDNVLGVRGDAPRGAASSGSRAVVEDRSIRAALARHGGNRTRAAEDLGVHRITLLRRMKRLGIP